MHNNTHDTAPSTPAGQVVHVCFAPAGVRDAAPSPRDASLRCVTAGTGTAASSTLLQRQRLPATPVKQRRTMHAPRSSAATTTWMQAAIVPLPQSDKDNDAARDAAAAAQCGGGSSVRATRSTGSRKRSSIEVLSQFSALSLGGGHDNDNADSDAARLWPSRRRRRCAAAPPHDAVGAVAQAVAPRSSTPACPLPLAVPTSATRHCVAAAATARGDGAKAWRGVATRALFASLSQSCTPQPPLLSLDAASQQSLASPQHSTLCDGAAAQRGDETAAMTTGGAQRRDGAAAMTTGGAPRRDSAAAAKDGQRRGGAAAMTSVLARRSLTCYREVRELGSGAFASVTLCEELSSGALVAVKASAPLHTATQLLRWRRERDMMRRVRGMPHVLQMTDAWEERSSGDDGDDDGGSGAGHGGSEAATVATRVYLQLVYCPGGSVAARAAARRAAAQPWRESEVVAFAAHMAIALDALHSARIAHVDFKPDNVLIDARGAHTLADLGCSVLVDDAGRARTRAAVAVAAQPVNDDDEAQRQDGGSAAVQASSSSSAQWRSACAAAVAGVGEDGSVAQQTWCTPLASSSGGGGMAMLGEDASMTATSSSQQQTSPASWPWWRHGEAARQHAPRAPLLLLDGEQTQASVDEGDCRYVCDDMLNAKSDLPAGDMFALGMSLYELLSGEALPQSGDAYRALRHGLPLHTLRERGYAAPLVDLVAALTQSQPRLRPTARQVLRRLHPPPTHAPLLAGDVLARLAQHARDEGDDDDDDKRGTTSPSLCDAALDALRTLQATCEATAWLLGDVLQAHDNHGKVANATRTATSARDVLAGGTDDDGSVSVAIMCTPTAVAAAASVAAAAPRSRCDANTAATTLLLSRPPQTMATATTTRQRCALAGDDVKDDDDTSAVRAACTPTMTTTTTTTAVTHCADVLWQQRMLQSNTTAAVAHTVSLRDDMCTPDEASTSRY